MTNQSSTESRSDRAAKGTPQNRASGHIKELLLAGALVVLGLYILGTSYLDRNNSDRELIAASAELGLTVLRIELTALEGVYAYHTSEGLLLGSVEQGVLIRGELEDLRSGAPIVVARQRPLPFVAEPADFEASNDRVALNAQPVTPEQGAITSALSMRLEQLRQQPQEDARAPSPAAPTPEPVELASAQVAPSVQEPTGVPGGAVPKIGYNNEGFALTEEQTIEQTKALMERLPEEWMVVYKAPDERHSITVMTDPTCPYCRGLHEAIDQINQAGITVRYLFYPRLLAAGPNDPRARQLVDRINAAWCSSNPKAAIDGLFRGESPGRACSSLPDDDLRPRDPAEDHFVIGEVLGLEGTPHVVHSSGVMWSGFGGVQDLIRRSNEANER